MNALEHLNDALAYIEEHLTEAIDFQEVARRALCSEYHFKRMFSFLAGVPLSEYVRRRRLTLAAFELQQSGGRVIDIAVKYGYDSPDAFARAFQLFHGVTPSEARSRGAALTSFPRMTFRIMIQGGVEMKYRIEERAAFRIVGVMKRVPIVFEGVNPDIAALAASLTEERITRLKSLSNVEPSGMISASANFSDGRMDEKGELDHYIGVATTLAAREEFASLDVAATSWAVFEAVGPFPSALQDVWGRIYSEWFPSSNYELAAGPEIVWHESKDSSLPAYRSEIWIPVRKK